MNTFQHVRPQPRVGALTPPSEAWTATDELVKELTPRWLSIAGIDHFITELEHLGPTDDRATQLRAVTLLGQATLTADIAALGTVAKALEGRNHADRARLVAVLGHLSGGSWPQVEASVTKLVTKASEEQHLAGRLVQRTRDVLAQRQGRHEFATWVAKNPAGFARYTWSVALRAAGERLWDHNWDKVAQLGNTPVTPDHPLVDPITPQRGWLDLRRSAQLARAAAIDHLVNAALSNDAKLRRDAWDDAIEAAYYAKGTETWSAETYELRARVGEAAWATANRSARSTVRVVINELPYVVGRIGMVALAAEASTAAARATAVRAGALAIVGVTDVDRAERAAQASMTSAVLPLSA